MIVDGAHLEVRDQTWLGLVLLGPGVVECLILYLFRPLLNETGIDVLAPGLSSRTLVQGGLLFDELVV